MCKVLIFAGTVEGRTIAEYLNVNHVPCHICVATEYGQSLLPEGEYLTVSHNRLTTEEMVQLMTEIDAAPVIDATHPYAEVVTKNIKTACEQAGRKYIRLNRDSHTVADDNVVYVDSVKAAVSYLEGTEGTILATTGSKELKEYTSLTDYQNRVFARVLSLPDVAAECAQLGFEGKHLICMQGPFSKELNMAMIRQLGTDWMVTKESGSSGGFMEKYEAAAETGTKLILVGRPAQETGMTLPECKAYLQKQLQLPVKQQITLVGIGMGTEDTLTREGARACREADLIIGARRMADMVRKPHQQFFYSYKPEEIREFIETHPECQKIAVALSGDVGFYSGAKKLVDVLERDVELVCGISSMIYFCSRLKTQWEDVKPCSLHGREGNIIGTIQNNPRVFAIVGNKDGIRMLCKKLNYYELGDVSVAIGEKLSYPDEKVTRGLAKEFVDYDTEGLSVILIENPRAKQRIVTHGIADSSFLRDRAPMTKEEVRSISLSKLRLTKESVIYDVGAGTGSVSVEMACMASEGQVFAVEKKEEAVELLHRNKKKFAVDNLTVIEGFAPGACEKLPRPTHAFIGGSSGNLKEIMELLLKKNDKVRMVINCITLETVAESLQCLKELPVTDVDIAQVSVGKSKEIGSYHMMMGQNPVYIISCQGGLER